MTLEMRLREVRGRLREAEYLDQQKIWNTNDTDVWRARHFVGQPVFYPVYRYRTFYSYNPIFLIALKKNIRINAQARKAASQPGFKYLSGSDTIDAEIVRIGGPPRNVPRISDPTQYVRAIADGLKSDVAAVEKAFPQKTNVVLCGGKDSLNLLLLPWKNPTVAYSAAPNYQLVREFVIENGLDIEVAELRDEPEEYVLRAEILANCCQMDLSDCRWTAMLHEIGRGCRHGVIFWKGQLADTFLTPYLGTLRGSRQRKERSVC
ncbi:MAG: hypothetical protein ACQESR_16755 [Planctomycetota bacterium]